VDLSAHEKQIAKDLGFDEKVIVLLKQYLHPETMMEVVPTTVEEPDAANGLELRIGSESAFPNENYRPPLLPEDKAAYLKIERDYPELKPIVKMALDFHDTVKETGSLQELGCRINVDTSRNLGGNPKTFETKEDAVKYLQNRGTVIDGLRLSVTPALSYEAIYPVSDADFNNLETKKILMMQDSPPYMDQKTIDQLAPAWNGRSTASMMTNVLGSDRINSFRIEPGSMVEKIGDRRWRMNRPARYVARAESHVASVMKVGKGSSGFNLVEKQGTNGLNYKISTEMILTKLKEWNEKYGVNVVEAKGDSLKVSFKNLPDDLSELCTEMFLFCPDLVEMQGSEQENAARMRRFAEELRKSKVADFWWD